MPIDCNQQSHTSMSCSEGSSLSAPWLNAAKLFIAPIGKSCKVETRKKAWNNTPEILSQVICGARHTGSENNNINSTDPYCYYWRPIPHLTWPEGTQWIHDIHDLLISIYTTNMVSSRWIWTDYNLKTYICWVLWTMIVTEVYWKLIYKVDPSHHYNIYHPGKR